VIVSFVVPKNAIPWMADYYTLLTVQGVLGIIVVIAFARALLVRMTSNKRLRAEVVRGTESRKRFGAAYGFASIIVLQIINSSEAFKGYKVLLSVIDLGVLFYLCFFSSWFRNKVSGWINRWEQMRER
jgi:hypothetical protein